ncbi:hypothetical protein [Azohydromonas australica]|uniref:hypothetical protein n=1 Tax=Azohydromonas australica TaxID=364039 RepID=UPI000427DE19|nr:hypothetical protein [Azohydromonas australica]
MSRTPYGITWWGEQWLQAPERIGFTAVSKLCEPLWRLLRRSGIELECRLSS